MPDSEELISLGDQDRDWLIRTKLTSPSLQDSMIARNHLLEALDHALSSGLLIVAAPAGYGKTTLLSQWMNGLEARSVHTAWISLDENDADVNLFLSYVILAIVESGVQLDRLESLATQGFGGTSPKAVLAMLFDELSNVSDRIVLVLDDYHRLNSTAIDGLIEDLVKVRSTNFALAISSRTKLDLDISVQIVTGNAIEIKGEALRLSDAEVRSIIGESLPEETLKIWFSKIEGWAVAAQLAKVLVTRSDDNLSDSQNTLLGLLEERDGHFANYLTEQVILKLNDDVQDLLIKTSIFERFNYELAGHAASIPISRELFQSLDSLSTLIVPIGKDKNWFRFHHLFAECLSGLLAHRFDVIEIREMHNRAAHWFKQHHFIGEAVKHSCLADNFCNAARLIEEAGGWELILYGGIGYLRSLVRQIPEKETTRFPRILIANSYLALKDGDVREAKRLFQLAESKKRLLEELAVDDDVPLNRALSRDMLNVRILLDAYSDKLEGLDADIDFSDFNDVSKADDTLTKGIVECNRVIFCLAHGQFARAQDTSRDAKIAMRLSDSVLGLNYCYLHSGLAAFYQGDLQLAEANFWEASTMAEDNFGADSGLQALSQVLLSGLFYWQGKFNCKDTIEKFNKASAHVVDYDGWFEIFAVALETGFSHDLSATHTTSTDVLERTRFIAEERSIKRLQWMVQACDLIIAIRNGAKAAVDMAHALEQEMSIDCCHHEPFMWRPFQFVSMAMAEFYEPINRAKSMAYADARVESCQAIGAKLYLVPALLTRALYYDKIGNREKALQDVFGASEIAAKDKIYQPFMLRRGLGHILRSALKIGKEQAISPIVQRFIADCVKRQNIEIEQKLCEVGLSMREYEVLMELDNGLRNKEIARLLDLTEHTVKFHLKNIFNKLDVDKRQSAVEVARDRNIIC